MKYRLRINLIILAILYIIAAVALYVDPKARSVIIVLPIFYCFAVVTLLFSKGMGYILGQVRGIISQGVSR